MYFWKCWRYTRTRFFYALIIVVVLFSFFAASMVKFSDLDAMRNSPMRSSLRDWASATSGIFAVWGFFYILIWALIMGGSSLGEEFRDRTADFLLVRPCRRRRWVWTGWSVGIAELAIGVLLMTGVTLATMGYFRGNFPNWRPAAMTLPLVLDGALVYGLTYLITLLTRGGRQWLPYSIGILFIDILVPKVLARHFNVGFLSFGSVQGGVLEWVTHHSGVFPVTRLLVWTVVALAFPLASQLFLEHAEA